MDAIWIFIAALGHRQRRDRPSATRASLLKAAIASP
jgi:hypothetical protein